MFYKVPVVWSSMGYVKVSADDAASAKAYVKEHLDDIPLPKDGEYLDDSFEIDEEGEVIPVTRYYIGEPGSTGRQFNTRKEFIRAIKDLADICEGTGEECFEIEIVNY